MIPTNIPGYHYGENSASSNLLSKGRYSTAGNASGINDGAAMIIVMSKEKADELGIKPMARIVSYASGGVDPRL